MERRIPYYDILKGFAMALIVCSHLLSREYALISGAGKAFLDVINQTHLPILFLISGYFSYRVLQNSFGEVLRCKFRRLLVPYFFWTLIAVAAKQTALIRSGSYSLAASLTGLAENLLFGESLWFFLCLFEIFLAAKLLIAINEKSRPAAWALLALATLLQNQIGFLCLDRIPQYLAVFLAGYWLRKADKGPHRQLCFRWPALFLPAIAIAITLIPFPTYWLRAILSLVSQACLVLFTLRCVMPLLSRGGGEPVFSLFGRYSLDIYCIHMMFISYLPLPAIDLTALPGIDVIYWLVAALLICLAVCLLAWLVLHRIPLYRRLLLGEDQ